jgi:CRP-like cAMP-binding protein
MLHGPFMLTTNALFDRRAAIYKRLIFSAMKMGPPAHTDCLYHPGETIFHTGSEPFGVYFVHHGVVKLFKSGKAGRQHITYMGGQGDLFGYRALLAGELYKVTAQSLHQSKVSFIRKDLFLAALEKDPLLAQLLLRTLSVELGDVEDRLVGAVQVPAEQRVARALCFLMRNYGLDSSGVLKLDLSRGDISELSDTAAETLMRCLGDMEKSRLILREKKHLKILDVDGLKKEAGL